ncbi:MAG: AtpZ/AtpI family protein [Alphaproteobacteria bacterium]
MTEFDQSDRDHVQDLASRIHAAQQAGTDRPDLLLPVTDRQALSAGRIGFEFMGAVLAGLGIGWLVDGQFATSPWGVLIGLFAGFVAGIANAWRTLSGVTQAVGWRPPPGKKRD